MKRAALIAALFVFNFSTKNQLDEFTVYLYNVLTSLHEEKAITLLRTEKTMANRVGQRIDNYVLTRQLGAGAFGEVYLAEHIYRKNQVAVKVLPQLADNDLPNFLNEARTIRLRHPNIVQFLDFGVAERIPFIVMEYIPMGTLRQRYPYGTRLSLDTIILYVNQIASALKYAHDEKLIHRDVKPENILVRSGDEVVLSDFGIVAMAHSSRSQSLQEMAGTITYMAPEQLHGRPVVASDQYALGVIVYEWLCGERPFKGTAMEIATQHMLTPPPALLEKVPGISPSVQQVVFTALEKDPNKRFPDIQAFAKALEQAAYPSPQIASPPILSLPPEIKSFPVVAPLTRPTQETFSSNILPLSIENPKSFIPVSSQPPSTHAPFYGASASTEGNRPIGSQQNMAVVERKGKRLKFVIIPLALLLIAGLIGSGIFYFLHSNQNLSITQTLDKAQQKIEAAKNEDPGQALKDLSIAQNTLRTLPPTLDSAQSGQLIALQHQLATQVQTAIGQYNKVNQIAVLPCHGTRTNTVNVGNINIQAQTIVAVQNDKGLGYSLFTLGATPDKAGSVYQITNQSSVVPVLAGSTSAAGSFIYLSLASGGSQLFTLAEQLQVKNGVSVSTSYTLSMYTVDANGTPALAASATIPNTANGYTPVPAAFTAWGANVYVVLSNQNQGRILKFAPDGKGHLQSAAPFYFSSSATITSVAAFANQFFVLFSDGHVTSVPVTATGISPTFAPVLSPAIPTPLPVTSLTSPATLVPTVIPVTQNANVSLNVPSTPQASGMLASGVVNGTPHLYIGDPTNHRVLDLEIAQVSAPGTPTATATSTAAVITVTMQPVQQLVYPQFGTLKGIAADPQGATINVLTQSDASHLNLVSVGSSTQTGCVSGS